MKRNILIIVLLVACLGGWYGYHEYNRKNKDLAFAKADFKVDAIALINEFEKDSLANKKYLNKIISVTGNVKKIDADGNPVIIFLGDVNNMSSVKCSMDSTHKKDYEAIKPGNKISVKGICTGGQQQDMFGTDVTLNYCVPEKNN
ncbi:MAG TPA: hypothetical protein VGO09_04430 [Flavisolibacter sp.]|nr:hypothetical protein [Flavisolibacter sp.]